MNPTTYTFGVKPDSQILTELNEIGLAVTVTSFASSSGSAPYTIVTSDVLSTEDQDTIIGYFGASNDMQAST